LEISNENSRRRTILSTPKADMIMHHEQQQKDVLDLDESVYAEHDYDNFDHELKEELPTISEMSFNTWSLPKNSGSIETNHYENVQNVNKKHKHEKIIDGFLKNNEFVYKKDLDKTRLRRLNRQMQSTPRLSEDVHVHGIDDIFNSVRKQKGAKNTSTKKKSIKKKKKKKKRKKEKVERIKSLHIDLDAEYMQYNENGNENEQRQRTNHKLPVLMMESKSNDYLQHYHHNMKLPISHQSMYSHDQSPFACITPTRYNHFNKRFQYIPIPPPPKQIQPQH